MNPIKERYVVKEHRTAVVTYTFDEPVVVETEKRGKVLVLALKTWVSKQDGQWTRTDVRGTVLRLNHLTGQWRRHSYKMHIPLDARMKRIVDRCVRLTARYDTWTGN